MSNKENLIKFGKVLTTFLITMIAIISNTAVWNATAVGACNSFICGVSVVNFLIEGFGIYKLVRNWLLK